MKLFYTSIFFPNEIEAKMLMKYHKSLDNSVKNDINFSEFENIVCRKIKCLKVSNNLETYPSYMVPI